MVKNLTIVCAAAAFSLSVLSGPAAEKKAVDLSKIPPSSDKTGVTYVTDIKPIFDKSCIKCHDAQKPKAKLRLDSLEGVLKGGEDGKMVVPGNSAGSVLVHNIAHAGDPDGYMPPPKNKANIPPLTKEQIGLIRAWIDQGAK
jgi:Planctomycete cytochrome C